MKFYSTIAVLFLVFTTHAQTLLFDSTFGTNGKVPLNTGVSYNYIRDAAMQADGKAVVLTNPTYSGIPNIALLRYNTDGTIDSTFSGDGIADSLFSNDNCRAGVLKIQGDGKIVVSGYKNSSPEASFIIRYNTEGTFDTTFGNNGIRYLPASLAYISDFVVLPTGKYMLISNLPSFGYRPAFTRLNSNGNNDSTFATAGTYTSFEDFSATSIDLLSNGKFLLFAGSKIIRANPNGTTDFTFGTNGYIALSTGLTSNDQVVEIALQPSGKIITRGRPAALNTFTYNHFVRYNVDGTADNTFGTNGGQYIYFGAANFIIGGYPTTDEEQMSLQADGKILMAGYTKNSAGNYTLATVRLTTDGAVDNTFDTDGYAAVQVNRYGSYGLMALQQPAGNITITGFARSNDRFGIAASILTATGQSTTNTGSIVAPGSGYDGNEGQNVLVQSDQKVITIKHRGNGVFTDLSADRVLANGTPDNGYGINGTANADLPGYSADAVYSGLLSTDALMLGTSFQDFQTVSVPLILRLGTTGNPDSSFGVNGRLLLYPTNSNLSYYLFHAAFQTDGKSVLLVGQSTPNMPDSLFIIRLNANGSYDNTFNGTGRKFFLAGNGGYGYKRMCLQPDNKILVAYISLSSFSNGVHTLVQRLNADGSADNTFNGGAARDITFEATNIVLQPDGKILAPGHESFVPKMARLTGTGTLDGTFGTGGVISFSGLANYQLTNVTSVATATDGKILFKAHAESPAYGGSVVQLFQLKPNGQYDSTFGFNGSARINGMYSGDFSGQTMALQPDNKVLITGYAYNYTNYPGITVRVKRENATGRPYTFTGSGLWTSPANWSDGTVPPSTIPAGSNLIINPPTGSECVVNIVVHVQAGATVVVKSGGKLRLQGGLIIQ